ncbi:MAG TPA: Hpt domain-containing protein [Candidatus Limnocylindrales bacterium]|nr:Hpt domain-containing protein [Candidatus Limnocylindrales bacterium]
MNKKLDKALFINHFREETTRYIHQICQWLLQLENDPDNNRLVSDVVREIRSLKGAARLLGYYDISSLAQKIEEIVVAVQVKRLNLNRSVMTVLVYALSILDDLIEGIYQGISKTLDLNAIHRLIDTLLTKREIDITYLSKIGGNFKLSFSKPMSPSLQSQTEVTNRPPVLSQPSVQTSVQTSSQPSVSVSDFIPIQVNDLYAILGLAQKLVTLTQTLNKDHEEALQLSQALQNQILQIRRRMEEYKESGGNRV